MELFSHRIGKKSVRSIIQIDSMDDDLRVGLWNAVSRVYVSEVNKLANSGGAWASSAPVDFLSGSTCEDTPMALYTGITLMKLGD